MSPDQEHRLEQIFSAARNLSPLERTAFLGQVCAGDAELRRQADSLLAAPPSRSNRLRKFFRKHPVWNSRDVLVIRLIIGLGWAVVLAVVLWELGIFRWICGPANLK